MPIANAKKIKSGKVITVINGATAVPQFDPVKIGPLTGFATTDFAASGEGEVSLEGILQLPCATSLGTVISGQIAYFSETNNNISQVVTDLPIGVVIGTPTAGVVNPETLNVFIQDDINRVAEITIGAAATSGTATITGLRANEHLAYGIMLQGATSRQVASCVSTADTATLTIDGVPGAGGFKAWVGKQVK